MFAIRIATLLCLLSFCIATQAQQATVTGAEMRLAEASKVAIKSGYGALPLAFEANQGQVDPRVRFASRGNGYSLFLTDTEAVLALSKGGMHRSHSHFSRAQHQTAAAKSNKQDVVRMQLSGAAAGLIAKGDDRQPGRANYFIGNDPAKWHSNVPVYSRVRYADVYPGVDLVYYGNQGHLEYDFLIAPNADPTTVRLQFAGAKRLKLSSNGDLEVVANNGEIAFQKPVVYQVTDGKRQPVEGSFILLSKNTVSFTLGSYDHSRELVIDPSLAYSTYFGGSNGDGGNGIAVDGSGNAYVTGVTSSPDFPISSGAYQGVDKDKPNSAFGEYSGTVYIAKLNPTGSALVYSTYLGGSSLDRANAIAVDSSGNAYLTGSAISTDFPVTTNAFQMTNNASENGGPNAFVTKLNAEGSSLVYSTYLGGSGTTALGDYGNSIAVDVSGDAYVTGSASSSNFPVTPGAFQQANHGAKNKVTNIFVTKLNATGSALVYSTYFGGSGTDAGDGIFNGDYPGGIAVDPSGSAYLAGYTFSTDFPVTTGAFETANSGAADGSSNGFVSKLSPSGSALAYSTYLGGANCSSIALDGSGNAYLTGVAGGPAFQVTSGAFQSDDSTAKAFVSKLNATGSAQVYSTFLGGSGGMNAIAGEAGFDYGNSVAVDASGNAYVTGYTFSPDFPITSDAFQTMNNGTENSVTNAFLTELNPTGSALIYSSYLGGSGILNSLPPNGIWVGDFGQGIAVDASGGVYLTGIASSTDFPVTTGALQRTNGGTTARTATSFVAKFSLAASGIQTVETPAFSVAAGTYTSEQSVAITDNTPGATIY